ncbi:uncharacterized protein LOC111189646 isoform X16 [Astyanax mexicanus]|uniref:uncharacterized protein LOC111189646 isoform X11 n=1 Tax=Astyanax mexicanus TaxID=7994 RepID=UPI0020CB1ED8|nr:uncharacterized protein LOC111189646 isoform X11 [Astyanax mexicanus]XP_049326626.1 uncharacterized protein LOC111189646 isoform X13 [Astyanax mexicanus]XP_049326627.1 uncharacterized protein LOC111189646 isoform X14 [Astyanax mexicanus]XP_049326629.1 uncharacterized protein LOC111189646 isoform X16 [Astyanax mexicanus]
MASPSRVRPLEVRTDCWKDSTIRPPAFACRKAWVKHILCVPTSRPQPAAIIPGPAAQALADPVWEVEDLDDEVEMSKEESDVSSVSSSSFFSDSDVYTSPFSSCSESSVEDLTTTVFPPELTGQGVTAPSPTIRTQSRSLKILTTNFWTSVFSRFRSRARVSVLVGEADPGLEAEPAAQDVQDLEERRDAVETPPKRKGGRRKLFLSCFRGSERD